MKKISPILLVFALVFALCACGAEEEPVAGIANPMRSVDDKEFKSFTGVDPTLPGGAENVAYFIIANELGELQFRSGSADWSFRVKQSKEAEDISGVYFSSPSVINSGDAVISVESDGSIGTVTWFKDGRSFALYMKGEVSDKALADMYENIL